MTEPVAAAHSGVPEVDPAQFNEFVESLSLDDVALLSQSSKRTGAGEAATTNFELDAAYQVDPDRIQYRFNARATMHSHDETEIGSVYVAVVVIIGCPTPPPSTDAVELFGSTSVPMMVHPYVREAISAAAGRVGFHGITLPVLVHSPIQTS
ncbi:hypothetical protein ACSMXN_05225 [Jatrophihabitans sp. DSM 45814]